MYNFEQDIELTDMPESFQAVQQSLNDFVAINYETALGLVLQPQLTEADILHYKGKVIDIIRNNPPLESLPRYIRDGRGDYLWYSEFYDDTGKDVFLQYSKFVTSAIAINKTNYARELAKIDLPYFRELVDLVSLERLCIKYEKLLPAPEENIVQEKQVTEKSSIVKETKTRLAKRSYKSKLNKEQYALLADCIEAIKLFRRKIKVAELRKLLSGKLTESLQVTNQKTLVYLLDQLMEAGHIKDTWMSVADSNKDFISFRTEGNEERYGSKPHYITLQQLTNCRNRNKRERIHRLEDIDTLIDKLGEYRLQ